ncbi:MAG: DNA polymerase III subunit gamma/tau [Spirochaetales bacterium]
MAYEVTANRKRPADFETLVGQEFVVATLKNSLSSGRIAHAYLFAGPRGVGKTSAARILAKALNCEKGPTSNPCGVCPQCREISQGSAIDVIEIDGASNTSVNDVRQIKDEVLFAPSAGRYKVYIIDEVHMLSNSAFNALLKTIEEPPPYIVFIFATTEIHKVPQTIRSRCQQFNFRLIPIETILEKLQEASSDLGIEAEEGALLWIAREATGSLRDAYTIFDQVASFSEGKLTLSKIQEKLGLLGIERIHALVELLTEGKGAEALSLFNELVSAGVAVEQFVIELADYYRSLLFLKLGIHKPSLLGYTLDRFPEKVMEALSVRQIEKALSLLLELYRNLRYTLNSRFEVELVVSRLADLKNYLSREELLERIQFLRKELRSSFSSSAYAVGGKEAPADLVSQGLSPREKPAFSPPATPAMQPSSAMEGQEDQRENKGDREGETAAGPFQEEGVSSKYRSPEELSPEQWKAIVTGIRRKKLALSSALEKAESYRLEGNTLIVIFKNKFSADLVQADATTVSQKAKEVLGRFVEVLVYCDTPKAGSSKVEQREGEQGGEDFADSRKREEDRVEIARKVFRGEILP